ncbi:MAG: hypothetical protein K0Q80_1125 [Microvirga sp.]|nr:hypothetical protein [Microvirga sp.]
MTDDQHLKDTINRRNRPFECTPHAPDNTVETMTDLSNAMV